MVRASAPSSGLSVDAVEAGSGSRRAAQFVGRVGALAVALGVGVGVGLSPAVGFADPTGPVGGAGADTTSAGSGSGSSEGSTPRPPACITAFICRPNSRDQNAKCVYWNSFNVLSPASDRISSGA